MTDAVDDRPEPGRYCRVCKPHRLPSGPRRSEGHFGVRLNRVGPIGEDVDVTLDGVRQFADL